jgi:RNA polymerase sigma-70 factor, ECF subfamily
METAPLETSVSLLERLVGTPSESDWRQLLELYQPLLRDWLAQAGVASADMDDLSQEILLVVYREVRGFERRGPGAFRGWLRAILANRVRDHFRRQKYHPTAIGGSEFLRILNDLEEAGSALSRQWDREHDEHVAASLLRRVERDFAPTTWQAFCRHVLAGEPAARVAGELGLSLNSVLLAKSRVLKRVRQELVGLVD